MTVSIDVIKMVVVSSLLSLVLCIIAVLIAGSFERLFSLVTPTPKWPVFIVFAALWCISMKAAFWWVFQRYAFYGSK